MKKSLILMISICLCLNVFAQKKAENIKYEGVITQIETQENFMRMQIETPSKLVATYYEVTRFCYISDQLPTNVQIQGDICNFLSPKQVCDDAATLVSTKQINPRKYTMKMEKGKYNAYTIGNSGYYVIVYPEDEFVKNRIAFMKEYGF